MGYAMRKIQRPTYWTALIGLTDTVRGQNPRPELPMGVLGSVTPNGRNAIEGLVIEKPFLNNNFCEQCERLASELCYFCVNSEPVEARNLSGLPVRRVGSGRQSAKPLSVPQVCRPGID